MIFSVSPHMRNRALQSPSILPLLYKYILFKVHPFWIQLSYFILVSSLGFLALKFLPQKNSALRLKNLDVFFTSVSAGTVSSMSTIEIEAFSNPQLLVLTLLMLLGGEVFTSMLALQLKKLKQSPKRNNSTTSLPTNSDLITLKKSDLKSNSIRYLGHVVLAYLILSHASAYAMIFAYISLIPNARGVLHSKGLNAHTFTIFTVVSSFTNCGFIPTNENMMVFKTCSALLLMIITLVLSGNTLFPPCLRSFIWLLKRLTGREEFAYLLKDNNGELLGFSHLLPGLHSVMLALTVAGFVVVQVILFCCMEWGSEGLEGMNAYQKIVGAFFESVNSRHAGETIVDLSAISSAILVLYIIMMYLPPYTCFLPIEQQQQQQQQQQQHQLQNDDNDDDAKKGRDVFEKLIFSELSYLSIFTIIICITERNNISHDPLNFNVLNIVTEIISAYGNVGFTTGYSCKRQLSPDPNCKDSWAGFSGRWTGKGKLILIFIMFFGRLKKFHMHGGKAWKLG